MDIPFVAHYNNYEFGVYQKNSASRDKLPNPDGSILIQKGVDDDPTAETDEEIFIDAVMNRRSSDEVMATLPKSILENTILAGRKLALRPVNKLANNYDHDRFFTICHDHGLELPEAISTSELVLLNSGYITAALLRMHLARGYGFCVRLCEDLIEQKQAVEKPAGRQLYKLPKNKQLGGW